MSATGTLLFNQLIKNGNFESSNYYKFVNIRAGIHDNQCDCTLTSISKNLWYYNYVEQESCINGYHKLYFSFNGQNKLSGCNLYRILLINRGGSVTHSADLSIVKNNAMERFEGILHYQLSYTSTSNRFWIAPVYKSSTTQPNVGESFTLKDIMLIDLTAMYGTGNEPTTVGQVKADCMAIGHDLDVYQPYTPILDVNNMWLRRRAMMQPKVVVTFQEFVNALTELGCTTGTDEYGFYVNAAGSLVGRQRLFEGRFESNKNYIAFAKSDRSPFLYNFGFAKKDGSYFYIDSSLTGEYTIANNVDYIYGTWYYGTVRVYDFYIVEVT